MSARLNVFESPIAQQVIKRFVAAEQAVAGSTVPPATLELVRIRASQINGCGFCVDMHSKDAAAAGEDPTRVNLVAAWREATVYTAAERAALELAEQGTRLADRTDGVSDEVWGNAAEHYDEEQLTALVCAIALINAYNRANVIIRQPAGGYVPGTFG